MIESFIFVFALLSGYSRYQEVAMLDESKFRLALRLLPGLAYILLGVSAVAVQAAFLYLVGLVMLLHLIDSFASFIADYVAARRAVPPTHKDIHHRLRYAPYVLGLLVFIYALTTYNFPNPPRLQPAPLPVPTADTIAVSHEADVLQAKWDSLKLINP